MKVTHMARALGISRAAVDKCRAAGMPMDTEEAARAWRMQHLHPGRMKRPPQAAEPPPWPGGLAQLLDDLEWFARTAAENPDDEAWLYGVRVLISLLTDEQFDAIRLPMSVWYRLMKAWGAVPPGGQAGTGAEQPPAPAPAVVEAARPSAVQAPAPAPATVEPAKPSAVQTPALGQVGGNAVRAPALPPPLAGDDYWRGRDE